MGVSLFPPIGTASDKWELISSTSASGSTVTFSSISGYRKLAVEFIALGSSTTANHSITINNDSGNNYQYVVSTGSVFAAQNKLPIGITSSFGSSDTAYGIIQIDNCDSSTIKFITGATYVSTPNNLIFWENSYYSGSATVSSIEVKSGGTMNKGTIKLYGVKS